MLSCGKAKDDKGTEASSAASVTQSKEAILFCHWHKKKKE
jgi:hypothetical protein